MNSSMADNSRILSLVTEHVSWFGRNRCHLAVRDNVSHLSITSVVFVDDPYGIRQTQPDAPIGPPQAFVTRFDVHGFVPSRQGRRIERKAEIPEASLNTRRIASVSAPAHKSFIKSAKTAFISFSSNRPVDRLLPRRTWSVLAPCDGGRTRGRRCRGLKHDSRT
jgi:hypothetical protein